MTQDLSSTMALHKHRESLCIPIDARNLGGDPCGTPDFPPYFPSQPEIATVETELNNQYHRPCTLHALVMLRRYRLPFHAAPRDMQHRYDIATSNIPIIARPQTTQTLPVQLAPRMMAG